DQHNRELQPGAEQPPGQRREDAECRVRDRDAENVERGERDAMTAAAAALRSEVADRDRDQRIDARRQIEREAEDEDGEQRERKAALCERAADVAREEIRILRRVGESREV